MVMVLVIECDGVNIFLFNIYLPCYMNNVEYEVDLLECISHIEMIYSQQNDKLSNMELLIIGDYNVDYSKMFNCRNAGIILELMTEHNLTCFIKDIENRGGYTFHNDGTKVRSMIDHCMSSQYLTGEISLINIDDNVDDWSDHKPLIVELTE